MDSILDSVEGVILRKIRLREACVPKCMARNESKVVIVQRGHCTERLWKHMTDLFSWGLRPENVGATKSRQGSYYLATHCRNGLI